MIHKFRRSGLLYTLGGLVNRFVPSRLFRFRSFVVYEMDPAKFSPIDCLNSAADSSAPKSLESDARSVAKLSDNPVALSDAQQVANSRVEVSWCKTEDDLRAVEVLTYTDAKMVGSPFEIAQAKVGDRLAGALWSVQDEFLEQELGVQYQLDPGTVWLFAALVDKQFRRQGVYLKVLRFMCCCGRPGQSIQNMLIDQNDQNERSDPNDGQHQMGSVNGSELSHPTQRNLLCINPFNVASMKAHQKFVKCELGRAWVVKVFNKAICLHQGDLLSIDSAWTFNAAENPITISFKKI